MFCQWLLSEEYYGANVLCHNFKGYDCYWILQYLCKHSILPEVITTGSTYLSIYVPQCKIRFLDSINFLPMALGDLPDSFDLKELHKGYFPRLLVFNCKENQSAMLSQLPDKQYYQPNGMKPDKWQCFLKWYEEHKNDPFHFQEELLRYCRSDVDILRQSCLKFRQMFIDISTKNGSGIDPFEHCITIASACNLVFRTNYLDPESLGIIPSHGYRPQQNQSNKAVKWLKYMCTRENIQIQHALNASEMQIGPFTVDDYQENASGDKIVYEFHGCFWHGCPK